MRLHPPFIQHVVLIRKGRVEEQPVYITNNNTVQYKHYSSSYPLVAFAFTCSGPCEPIQFEPPCVDYVSVVVSWKVSLSRAKNVVNAYKTLKFWNWKAAIFTNLSLRDISSNFEALWEVKRCLMQCGKVQFWPLDWMSAWLRSHEQRLHPPFCSNIQTCSGRHKGGHVRSELGHRYRQTNVKLLRTLNVWGIFYWGSDKGVNCLSWLEIVT